jgi:hypothetical protein
MRFFFAAVFLLWTAGFCFAHSDPLGEVHPQVTANQDGSFTVTFGYRYGQRTGRLRMMVGADGKELVARHWIKPGADDDERALPSKDSSQIRYVPAGEEGALGREVLVTRVENNKGGAEKTTARTLPFAAPSYPNGFTETAGKEAACVSADAVEGRDKGAQFKLTWSRSDGFQAARSVTLGTVGTIYDEPSASPLVWSAGRWWVAWVKEEKKEDKYTWTTVLSSVDPASGKVEHHELPGISNWNTSPKIAVNAAGTFCVAWHASVDGTYPGKAKVVTAVFTPGK